MKKNPESFIRDLFAQRIGGRNFGHGTKTYKFEKIRRAKSKYISEFPNRKLLDFGVGEPDSSPERKICNELYKWSLKPARELQTGKDEFRKAAAKYMRDCFGVAGIDHEKNVISTIGSKEALANLPKAIIDPGDISLVTTPGYPVLGTNTEYLGGKVFSLPLNSGNDFYPDLESIPSDTAQRAKILYLNYPNNPTGKCATVDFYKKAISFAKENKIAIVQDATYIRVVFNREPLSILAVPGGMDVAIELHSFSKSFSMTGWRLGFAAGNQWLISGLETIKDNTDSGSFEAIRKAGIYALEHTNNEMNRVYERRLRLLAETLSKAGLDARMPEGTFFLFMESPGLVKGNGMVTSFSTAEEFSKFLLEKLGIVTVPWDENGGHYVRFSAAYAADESEIEKMKELAERLSGMTFI